MECCSASARISSVLLAKPLHDNEHRPTSVSHSRAETTMKRYVHLSQQADMEAADAMSRRLRRPLRKAKAANSVSNFVSRNELVAATGA